jgi:hypothetical protein
MNAIKTTQPIQIRLKGIKYSLYLLSKLNILKLGACQRFYSTSKQPNARWLRTKATTKKVPMPFFDAERFARLLEKEGFSSAQAKTVIHALDDVVNERYVCLF